MAGRRRYIWFVGVVFVVALVIAGINAARNSGGSLFGPAPGTPLPRFAAPAATSQLSGVADVRQSPTDSASGGRLPACDVRGPGIVNSCELSEKHLVLTLIATRQTGCVRELDTIEANRGRFPDVNFATVVTGDDQETVRKLAATHHLGFPVAVDRDGAVANLYRVGVCPTTVFAQPGGQVSAVTLGMLDAGALDVKTQALVAGTLRPGP